MTEQEVFEKRKIELFTTLFDAEWDGKKLWEHIHDGKLTATPAFEGSQYRESNPKIMFVGRALNGWDERLGDCSTLQNTVESILCQEGALDTFVDDRGFGNGSRKYYHKNSKFFRYIKHILEFVGESDTGINETWYHDSKQWNQRFVWANLFCIAPRNPVPGTNANPANKMIKPNISEYIDLMKLYIDYYRPDAVVFITDVYGWFVPWTRQRSFKDITDGYQHYPESQVIAATGSIGKSRIAVSKRPDRRGMSYKSVEDMARITADWILSNGV